MALECVSTPTRAPFGRLTRHDDCSPRDREDSEIAKDQRLKEGKETGKQSRSDRVKSCAHSLLPPPSPGDIDLYYALVDSNWSKVVRRIYNCAQVSRTP